MPRELIYTIRTRQQGEPWRTTWRGQGEQIACDAARALAAETRTIDGWDGVLHVHPYVRVWQSKEIVLDITPANRKQVA
jgi:hypothetical protein